MGRKAAERHPLSAPADLLSSSFLWTRQQHAQSLKPTTAQRGPGKCARAPRAGRRCVPPRPHLHAGTVPQAAPTAPASALAPVRSPQSPWGHPLKIEITGHFPAWRPPLNPHYLLSWSLCPAGLLCRPPPTSLRPSLPAHSLVFYSWVVFFSWIACLPNGFITSSLLSLRSQLKFHLLINTLLASQSKAVPRSFSLTSSAFIFALFMVI